MARYSEYYGKPIFRVHFTRTDEPGRDLLCVAAWSKQEAEAAAHRMYAGRIKTVHRVTRELAA